MTLRRFADLHLSRALMVCIGCGETKQPTRAYIRLLKSRNLPYLCQHCRSQEQPAMKIGKLGVVS